jgi:adenylate kinase
MNSLYKDLEVELMNAIIFGPPGSGKGTYASILEKKLGIVKVSTGDMVREEESRGTDLGKKMKEYKDRGELVPDEIIIEVLKRRISEPDCIEKGFILDGYPRTIPQAEALSKIAKIDVIINLNVPDWIIIERLSNRRTCKECGTNFNVKYLKPKIEGICDKCGGELYQREDDKPEVIKERIRVYQEQTRPVLEYYKGKIPFVEFECDSPDIPPEVNAEKILEKLKNLGFYE